ncbi:sigma 54-interacting transcriptional regulator [Symmachiella dynata]|uniref:Transcriptional regulatory protein ZraR n=1 Tax=Symmachiella dynata TaxID=2527995 RepID=A0A517ZS60_9PLAN|nr:sigma 54-interacting transcriptional regulator [Symmachiella dynata]QDT49588.1 Transcriptional regulatory protein ZraR [Symmachiella dynata]QDU45293.1 Transcriptional regulatory protein ZraR [Symmachiella dynata]
MIAYLVVREDNKWRDIYRLMPGQVITVGRAATNRIALQDEVCSRNHCELYHSEGAWVLRDLGSRNGTYVEGTAVTGDCPLEPGQLIEIGACKLAFTDDLSRAFPILDEEGSGVEDDTGTAFEDVLDHPPPMTEPAIIHRRRRTRFRITTDRDPIAVDRTSQVLAQLYRLALEMGSAKDYRRLAEVVLSGLFESSRADVGAILLLPEGTDPANSPGSLNVVAYQTQNDRPYQTISDYLSGIVLREREAILARDVADDSRLINRDSLGQIHAQSVICAPICLGQVVYGLVHLYTTNAKDPLDPDDLEFTLAVADQFAVAMENLRRQESLAEGLEKVRDENKHLREQLAIQSELVGQSPAMHRLSLKIARIAPTDTTALIRGESGVGKELVARAIHFSSERRNGPFVCMNCAALSESLLESELFGHERGSFTGATGRKVGKFEQADKGTLMLDEVGEMSQAIQAKFLRVLEGHPFERVGGGTPVNVDVRIVAATNRDLELAVKEGSFRRDLYFRLHVVEIIVEPLRDHPSDIPELANHFLERFVKSTGRPARGFTPQALAKLAGYDWPGNVRELQNTVERAVIFSTGEFIADHDIHLSGLGIDEELPPETEVAANYREISIEKLEQEHILATLEETKWNKSKAAQILGIERSTLDRKLKRYAVTRPNDV